MDGRDEVVIVVLLSHIVVVVDPGLVEVCWEGVLLGDLWSFPGGGVRGPEGGRSRGRIVGICSISGLMALNRITARRNNRDLGCERPNGLADHPLDGRKDTHSRRIKR